MKFKMFNEHQLAGLLCILNDIAADDPDDGSPNWWMFAADARKMLATVDYERYETVPMSSAALEPTSKEK